MRAGPNRILFALIHNGDVDRLSHVRPKIAELRHALQNQMGIQCIEIAWQPPIVPISARAALVRELWSFRLCFVDWQKYKLLKPFGWRDLTKAFLKERLPKYFGGTDSDVRALDKLRRTNAIESIVTDKHLRALGAALDGSFDYVIVCEDDAVFEQGSVIKVAHMLAELPEGPLYCDLAGGLPKEILQVDRLVAGHVDLNGVACVRYASPVTNTGCCYLFDNKMIAGLSAYILAHPSVRVLPFDWILNIYFMALRKTGQNIVCLHAEPPVVKHGSAVGSYEPWRAQPE